MAQPRAQAILFLSKTQGFAPMPNMRTSLSVIFFGIAFSSQAQDYQGASAVLKLLAEKAQEQPAEKKADPVEELRLKVKALRSEAALAPVEAAKRWLALLDAYLTIPAEQLYSNRAYEDRLSLGTICLLYTSRCV